MHTIAYQKELTLTVIQRQTTTITITTNHLVSNQKKKEKQWWTKISDTITNWTKAWKL